MQRPGGLADVSVPDVVREDALRLVLQHLHAAWLGQAARLRLEEHDGLHAAALGGVRRHVAEPGTLLIVRHNIYSSLKSADMANDLQRQLNIVGYIEKLKPHLNSFDIDLKYIIPCFTWK